MAQQSPEPPDQAAEERLRRSARYRQDRNLRDARSERKKIEMLFAHLKRILRLDRLRLRGPSGAQDEFLLAATVQNLRKMAKLIPLPPRYRPESQQAHARLIPCNFPISWAVDFFTQFARSGHYKL
jgi:uncharacterized protein with von Willebrand factor type A (vWA) domain